MSNHEERSHIVNTTFDGNHLNRPMEFSEDASYPEEEDMIDCEGCNKPMEWGKFYVNGGLCFQCIMNIGK